MNTNNDAATQEIVQYKPGPYWYDRGTDGVDDVWYIHAGTEKRSFASMAFWDSEDGSKGRMFGATAKLLADWKENDAALEAGCRILSSYQSSGNITFWIITEADRSSTTVLLPEEY